MGFSGRLRLGLLLRTLALLAALLIAALAMTREGLIVARVVALGLVALAAFLLWRHIDRTNLELSRFVEALGHGDLAIGFGGGRGGSFDRLRQALGDAVKRLRDERALVEESGRFHASLVEDAPTALLTVDHEDRVTPVNKAARRLFARAQGVAIDDYAVYGASLVEALRARTAGGGRLVTLATELGPQQAMLRVAELNRLGRTMRVVSVQPIQAALNAVELAAQSDLIRILTHEIMNSMTPITSLARSAADLIAASDTGRDPAIADARLAVDTLARRADGVLHFVGTYRQISRPIRINRRPFAARPFVMELERLFAADPAMAGACLTATVDPADLTLDADPDLIAQVMLNLLRNAVEAAGNTVRITLEATVGAMGSARLVIADDGPGIPVSKRPDVFLPFYTTKPTGTGVGLSFARQVMLAHDGAILLDDAPAGGARFTLVL